MKTQIIISVIFIGIMTTGCSTTTYVSLEKNNRAIIEDKLIDAEKDEVVGAEVTLSLKDGTKVDGELLSVRENSMTICVEHSATEEELAKLIYPVTAVQNDDIQELTIEGSNYVWIGIGSGLFVGLLIGVSEIAEGVLKETKVAEIFAPIIIYPIVSGIVGYLFSTDDIILQEIPPGYDMSLLKPLARYPDDEPEYLRAIK